MQQFRLWTLTAGVTILIWIAADQRVTRFEEFRMPFSIRSAVPGKLSVRFLEDKFDYITLGFRGPSRTIAQLRDRQETLAAHLEIGDQEPGPYRLDLLRELRSQMRQFPDGLVLVSAMPSTAKIELDRFVDRQVALVVGKSRYEFDGSPQLDPPSVSVRVAEKRFESLPKEQRVITMPLERALEGALEAGQVVQKSLLVPRVLDGGLEVEQVTPEQITIVATLRKRIEEGRITTVPIHVMANLDLFQRYELNFVEAPENAPVTRPVTVRGPAEVVRELLDNPSKFGITGYIQIGRKDEPAAGQGSITIPKEVHIINLPKGVELVSEPEKVDIELIPRN